MLREAKIGQFDVPIDGDEDILGLQISVYDVQGVKIMQRNRNFGCVELGYWLSERIILAQSAQSVWGVVTL